MYRTTSTFSIFTVLLLIFSLTGFAFAQTVPGKNLNILATGTGVRGISHDSDGNAYTMGRDTGTVYKITPTGSLITIKEMGTGFYVGPFFDQATGDIYISDCTGAILRLNPSTGAVSTLATVGTSCAGGFTSDAAGNIYVSDFLAVGSVVKITPSGGMSTYATGLSFPDGIDFGPDGELYVGNRGTSQVMVVSPGGGAASVFASGLNLPLDVLADDSGNVFAANFGNGTLSKITPGGTVSTIGTGFANPLGLAFDITGNLIIADFGGIGTIYSAGPLVLFSDTFDNDSIASGTTSLSKWTVTSGNVDVIGPGFADLYTENGTYLDMDGAISNATIESPTLTLSPGIYELSFELGNNSNLGSFDNGVLVSLGTVFSQTFLAPAHTNSTGEQLVKTKIRFVIENPTSASLIFQETGTASSGGAVVDDVLLVKTDVIEPLPANTEVVFSGSFDNNGLNDFTVTAGNVDLLTSWSAYPGNGSFIDMEGSTNGTIQSAALQLSPGTYQLTYGLGNNPFPNNSNTSNDNAVSVNLGTVHKQHFIAPIAKPDLEFYFVEFTVLTTTTANLSFQETGTSSWNGTILDDVLLTRTLPPNQLPVADAGLNQIVEQQGPDGSSVILDGSGSSDPDGDALTYEWSGDFGNASGEFPTVLIPAGTHVVTLVVNDGAVDSDPDTVQITVQDTTVPTITAPADVTEAATGVFTQVDLGTPTTADNVGVVSVTNDAPAAGFAVDSTTTVTWTAFDAAGNSSIATQTVTINPFVLGLITGKTKLKIHRGDGDKDKDKDNDHGAKDWLQIAGTLTEFVNGDGLNFLTDPVTIVLNGFTWNLPPGSFVLDKGDYKYKGGRTGLTEMKVKSNGKFKLKAKRMDLSGLSFGTPIPFAVTIGNDLGETDVTFNTRRGRDGDKDNDRKKKGKRK
jgi:sugar lactone lactonase YvrE